MMGPARYLRRRQALGALAVLVVAVAVAWWAWPAGGEHRVVVVTPNAEDIIAGLRVRSAGITVGSIDKATVTRDRQARLVLKLDDAAWPVPVDSTLQLRFGGTIKYSDRYLELRRGHARQTLADGGRFPAQRFTQPAEFDRLFGTFDRRTRANLTQVIDTGGPALHAIRRSLPAALQRTPPAWAQVAGAFREIGGDDRALDTLLGSTDAVVDSIHRADPGLAELVSDASSTFDSVASESGALRRTLSETPSTLVAARRILAQADGTLNRASRFARDVAPGVARLRDVTQPLAATLGAVERVSPDASRTLRTLRSSAPSLDALLGRAQDLMPGLESIGRQGTTQLDCIRPYSPEIAGFFATWGPRAWGNNDGKDTYMRGQLGTLGFPDTLPFDSKTFTTLFPSVKMSFPRPPGDLAGQPWYQPQCGITASAYDPAADPESARNLKAPSDPARSRP